MSHRRGPYRLPYGGQVDRTRKIAFRFNGREYLAHPGDTLASALLANGVRTVARSFKFHRPRGIYSAGMEEPSALLQLGSGAYSIPSARAPLVDLTAGLDARAHRGWPSVNFDVQRVLDWTAPLWAAGFYNKTFIWPRWHTYEGVIRRMAGLGSAPTQPDPDQYELQHLHCDVLVIGGGPAGIKAALDAGREGGRVLLVEQRGTLGGKTTSEEARVRELSLQLALLPEVRVLTRTTAVGAYDHGVFALVKRLAHSGMRERLLIVRTERAVLATGAIEQSLVFENNDRPGILLAGAARQYLRRFGVAVGRRVLIATNNNTPYSLAKELQDAGVTVLGVVDSRRRRDIPETLRTNLHRQFIELFPGSVPIATEGFGALKKVTIGRLSPGNGHVDALTTFKCDALAVSGGWAPALHLYAQAGGALVYDETSGVLQPTVSRATIQIVGSAAQRTAAGPRISPVGRPHRQWVDLLHDVTVADLKLAVRENFAAIEHVKRYTTVGMAPDQGKTSTPAALEIVGRLRGMSPRDLGHTTLRPPVTPVTLGTIVGRELRQFFSPTRLLPMHDWHQRNGAVMQDFGAWQRAVAYPRVGESREHAAQREAHTVRTAAGLFDGSSLGKIEIQGPDALEFLDRFYINNLKTLQPGRARYGLMLRESGTILDDGTVVALAPDHLLITTTSGNAGRVYRWLEEWHQCEWPDLKVAITPVTEQWATISLAGPLARGILSKLDSDIDLSTSVFPHLGMREGKLLGFPARIFRVSFTGELTYEINVPADSGLRVWQTLLAVGNAQGLQPIGMDALLQLRLEKGFLHVGTDTDGTTVPDDVGWGRIAANKSRDFIGKRSLALSAHTKPDRLQLVGLRPRAIVVSPDPTLPPCGGAVRALSMAALYNSALSVENAFRGAQPFEVGSHLRLKESSRPTDGWITSAGKTTFGAIPIALALLRAGRSYIGAEVTVFDGGVPVTRAEVVRPPFYNPSGERMNA